MLGTGFPGQEEMLTVLIDQGGRLQLFGDFRDMQRPKFAWQLAFYVFIEMDKLKPDFRL